MRSWSRCLGKLERAVDHLETSVSLLTKSKMIGICQNKSEGQILVSGEGEVEDRFELGFDRLDLSVDPRPDNGGNVARRRSRISGSVRATGDPRQPRRRELIGFTQLVDLAKHGRVLLHPIEPDRPRPRIDERYDTEPGHPIDRIRLGSDLIARACSKACSRAALSPVSSASFGADQEPPDRRCLLFFEHLEMPPHVGYVGRAVFKASQAPARSAHRGFPARRSKLLWPNSSIQAPGHRVSAS